VVLLRDYRDETYVSMVCSVLLVMNSLSLRFNAVAFYLDIAGECCLLIVVLPVEVADVVADMLAKEGL
jgi:hypothetical protein